jgi:hypothetical protein
MTSLAQKNAAKKNIKKAREEWQNMSTEERSSRQPKGRQRKKPGTTGEGEYFHVVVRDKNQFEDFRSQDVGDSGHSIRVAGKRKNGSWDTQKWLIKKTDAHIDRQGYLRADREKEQKVLSQLGSVPRHTGEDIFKSSPRKNVPEKNKPTAAQKKARAENIKKAQQSRHIAE